MLHRTFPLWLAIGFMLIVFTGYAVAEPIRTISYVQSSTVFGWLYSFGLLLVAYSAYLIYVHTQLRRLKREHTEREWTTKAGLWPEQRSLRELFQHMSDDTAATKPFVASVNRSRNQQPRFPTRQQPQHPRRDGRERYLTDPIEDQPRHPDGSALDAVARFYSTRERDSSSGE